jgi:hypothetical protein
VSDAIAIVATMTHEGIQPAYVDLALCRATTRRYPPNRVRHICDELRIAAASDRARPDHRLVDGRHRFRVESS